jgi:hypothetical protein
MRLFNRNPKQASLESAPTARDDRTVITEKLAACTASLREADADLSRLSLQAILTGDDAEALGAQAKLRALANLHGLLTAALVECQRIEAERQAELRSQQNVSAKRALAQHAGKFARDADDVAKAIADLKDATERMQSSAGSIVAVCPPHLRTPANPYHELLSPHGLNGRIAVEQFRLNRAGPKPRPGFEYEDRGTGHIKPMAETLAELVSRIRADFDNAPPQAPLVKVIDATPEPVSSPAGGDGSASPSTAGADRAAPLGAASRKPLTGIAVNAGTGEMVELTERFATESPQEPTTAPVRPLAVAEQADDAEGYGQSPDRAGAVDYTKLF